MKISLLVVALVGFHATASFAQGINSPYSGNGLGDLEFQGMPSSFAMGEVGIGTPQNWHINTQNPALLVNNLFSSYQLGLMGDFRKFTKLSGSEKSESFTLRSMAMSFPIMSKGRWISSFSLLPYSGVKYSTYSSDSLDNTRATTVSKGDGGLTELGWSNGFKIYKSLSFGLKASYIFGELNDASTIVLQSPDFANANNIVYQEVTTYSSFNFGGGLAYKIKLSNDRMLNLGMIYQLDTDLDGNRTISYIRSGTGSESELSSGKIAFEVPTQVGFGLSYEKVNVLKVGFDFEQQDWSKSNSEAPSETFQKKTRLAIGGEYVPDYQSVNSYMKRATYRLGMNFTESPYIVNNSKIKDFGINFGASFPMSGLSSMDAAFKIGVRGTTKNNLIRENYFQVVLGATINDRWFIKRRYD